VTPAEERGPDGGTAEGSAAGARRRVPGCVRLVSHLAVWVCVWVSAGLVLARGWTPVGDYAAIELHAYRTLSFHPPLLGMYSTAGFGVGHALFSPGPLSLWMLAVPVHVDPVHGLVWGSALWWGLALSLAIEAMWSAGRWIGCGLIALGVVDLLWAAPSLLENQAWNPYFPLPFLIAAMATAFVVAEGKFGWWPVLLFTGSVAAQTHLFYVLPAVALVVVAPVLGWFIGARPATLRWLSLGLGVGAVCWIAPLIQALGRNSNVAALARGTGGARTLGFGFGLRLVADSASASPIWLRRAPTGFYPDMAFAFGHQPVYGIGVLCVLVAASIYGFISKQPRIVAAGAVILVVTAGFAISFAMIPTATLIVVDYLLVVAWVLGLSVWILAAWCLLSIARSLLRAPVPSASHAPKAGVLALSGTALSGLMLGGLAVAIFRAVPADPNFGTNWNPQEAAEVGQIVSAVEHSTARKDVTVALDGAGTDRLRKVAIGEGVGLRLVLDGWRTGIAGVDPLLTSLPPIPRSAEVAFNVGTDAP
jgi:hypothetical protein